ncbi:MAG: hypothetical protein ACRENB_02805 [Gemmatimonadales bacterium]
MRVPRPVLAVGVLALLAGPALAQDKYATAELRAGYAVTLGEAKDSLNSSTSFGAGAAIALAQRLYLGFQVDWATHETKPITSPVREWSVLHAFLKVGYNIVDMPKWTVRLSGGPGIMSFSPNQELQTLFGSGNDVHFAVNGSIAVTYWFAERIGLHIAPQFDIAFKKTSGQIFKESSGMIFPLGGGLQFKI